ncbi:MAG: energy transducer TonB [Gammaproteobacteria bacterium]|nr:energy transducer TonB [Gammaproteobacteria bacterium]
MPLRRTENPAGRLISMAVVIIMHVFIVYGLAYGLSRANVEVMKGPLEADIIEMEEEEEEAEPPPPPPEFEPPPPEFVPPPEIAIALPAAAPATAITQVTSEKRAPAPPPPPPKAEKVVVLPKSVKYTQPDYPSASRRLNEEGSVVLALLIGEDGKVAEAKVESPSGFPRLDEAAVKEALRRWTFKAGTEDGKPKAMWHRVKVTFRLTT